MNRRRATRIYSPLGQDPALLRLPSVPGNRPESASEEVRQYGLESELPHTLPHTTRPKAPMGLYYEGGRNLPTTRINRMLVALIGNGSRLKSEEPCPGRSIQAESNQGTPEILRQDRDTYSERNLCRPLV